MAVRVLSLWERFQVLPLIAPAEGEIEKASLSQQPCSSQLHLRILVILYSSTPEMSSRFLKTFL